MKKKTAAARNAKHAHHVATDDERCSLQDRPIRRMTHPVTHFMRAAESSLPDTQKHLAEPFRTATLHQIDWQTMRVHCSTQNNNTAYFLKKAHAVCAEYIQRLAMGRAERRNLVPKPFI